MRKLSAEVPDLAMAIAMLFDSIGVNVETQVDTLLTLLLATAFVSTENQPGFNLPGATPQERLNWCLARLDELRREQYREATPDAQEAFEELIHAPYRTKN